MSAFTEMLCMDQEGEREGGAAWSNLQIGRVVNAHQVCLLSRQSEAVGIYCTENSGLEIEGNLSISAHQIRTDGPRNAAGHLSDEHEAVNKPLSVLCQPIFLPQSWNEQEGSLDGSLKPCSLL